MEVGSDDCGVFTSYVVLKSGTIEIADRVVTSYPADGVGFAVTAQGPPPQCPSAAPGLVRELLAARTEVVFDQTGLSLRSSKGIASLQAARLKGRQSVDVLRTVEKGCTYRVTWRVEIGPQWPSGARPMAMAGCDGARTILFGASRYLIVDNVPSLTFYGIPTKSPPIWMRATCCYVGVTSRIFA